MGLLSRNLRILRPTRFLGVMSLSTGVEMISIFMIFNKLTGFYGLLAVLTGLRLSPLQLTMYIYSCLAIVNLACLIPHIRKQSPFQCMILAYFYLIDTVINTLFTSAFAASWFLAVSGGNSVPKVTAGRERLVESSGFSNVKYNESDTEIISKPSSSVTAAQEAVVYGVASATASSGSRFEEIVPSVALVAALTIIRIYFIFVMLEYARQVIRRNSMQASSSKLHLHTDGCMDVVPGENPFEFGKPGGMGLRGKIGRIMIRIGEGYWLGENIEDDAWAKGLDGRFRTSKIVTGPPGTIERERRARSGTGPPAPSINS